MSHTRAGLCSTFPGGLFFDDYIARRLVGECTPTDALHSTWQPPCLGRADPGSLLPKIPKDLGQWTHVFNEKGGLFSDGRDACARQRCVAAAGWMPLVAVADDAAAFQKDTDLALAMHVLKSYDLVIVIERLAASVRVLACMLGYEGATALRLIAAASEAHKTHIPKIPNANGATKAKRYEQSKTERTPPEIVVAFNERNARDLVLYNLSNFMLTIALQNITAIQGDSKLSRQ